MLLKLLLLVLGHKPLRVLTFLEYVIRGIELDVGHLDHYLELLILQHLFHVGYLCLANLSVLLMVLNDLLLNEVVDLSIVELRSVADIIEVLQTLDLAKIVLVGQHLSSDLLFLF